MSSVQIDTGGEVEVQLSLISSASSSSVRANRDRSDTLDTNGGKRSLVFEEDDSIAENRNRTFTGSVYTDADSTDNGLETSASPGDDSETCSSSGGDADASPRCYFGSGNTWCVRYDHVE